MNNILKPKMQPLNVLIKPASGLCNMRCSYCFYCDETERRAVKSYGMMSLDTLKNVIRKTMLNARGYAGYLYQGGEPTLRGLDFFCAAVEYQRRYNRNNVTVYNSLQTNGYALDKEWCRLFREENFLIGLSVDGTQTIHDRHRRGMQGEGTYKKALQAAELFDRYHVEYNILTVVTADLSSHIREVYEEYYRRGWRRQQYILCLEPLEDCKSHSGSHIQPFQKAPPCSPTPEEYGAFLIQLFQLWYEDYRKGRQPYIREFDNYIRVLQGYLPENCAMRGTCSLQNVVEADGSVYPCDFYALDNYCLGNYNENTFAEIHNNPIAEEFLERSRELAEDCRSCEFFFLCRGGCRRNRVPEIGTGSHKNKFCTSYRSFFKECLEKMKEIAQI